jgi:hypothetical protein
MPPSQRLALAALAIALFPLFPAPSAPFPEDLAPPSLPPIPEGLANAWPDSWEQDFNRRAQAAIAASAAPGRFGNTFFENEKRSYPNAMFAILGGHRTEGLAFLQEEDNKAQDWNAHTLGIDYFPAFTLKGQIRKLFFFGHLLEPAYRDRMADAAKIFTGQDPFRRPHPAYRPDTEGWTPEARNSWVDIRNTDNLFLMRVTSVYLLAELAGNEGVRQDYLDQISSYVACLHHAGMAEWDSENYHGHSIAPLLNLYDFARDDRARAAAKAGLDWLFAAAAVKYLHGNMNGPSKRDYNQPAPLGGGAAKFLWLYFGQTPAPPSSHEPDLIHAITSRYRPPAATVALARKELPLPVEILAAKPDYQVWQGEWSTASHVYYETQYISPSFQLGTLLQGTQDPDVNGFKITAISSAHGAQTICSAPCSDPLKLGSPTYTSGILAPLSAVGQNGNMAIYLTAPSDKPYLWWLPADATTKGHGGLLTVRLEKAALAIWPINASIPALDPEATATVQAKEDGDPRWPTLSVFRSQIVDPELHYGFAIEIVEAPDDRAAEAFFALAAKAAPELDELPIRAAVAFTAPGEGRRVRLQWGDKPAAIKVWKDGSPFNLVDAPAAYRSPVIQQDWQGGTLSLKVGQHRFSSSWP